MPYNKEQLKAYWQANKAILNQKRKEKRRLARLTIVEEVSQIKQKQVSHKTGKVSHSEVSHKSAEVSPNQVSHQIKTANLKKVSHQKEMANLKADNYLVQLIKEWQTQTNYSCVSTCAHSYCNNCWYFANDQLVNYKGLSIRP